MLVNALLRNDAGNLLIFPFVQRAATLQNKKIVLGLAKAVKKLYNPAPEFIEAL